MNPVVHFEIPADNLQRAQAFYQKSFGWSIKPWKNDKMEYWSVLTKKDQKDPGINGGLMPRKYPSQPVCVYMTVPSIEKALASVVANGGSVCVPRTEIGENMGAFACFNDTEGNLVGVHEMPSKQSSVKKTAKKSAAKKKK